MNTKLYISIKRILKLSNPVETPPWPCANFTLENVLDAFHKGWLDCRQSDMVAETAEYHIKRIAWLMKTGWYDPIQIDVGIPDLGVFPEWYITDGNHRLYAAAARGDRRILAEVSGDVVVAKRLLGVRI